MQLSADVRPSLKPKRKRDRFVFWRRFSKTSRSLKSKEPEYESRSEADQRSIPFNIVDQSSEASFLSAISSVFPRDTMNTEMICSVLQRFGYQYTRIAEKANICFPRNFDITHYPSLILYGSQLSEDEKMCSLASSLCGYWITVLDRSDSIDEQFKFMGISSWKRSVLKKLSIPMTMFLEDHDEKEGYRVIHTWLHTPIGLRHMRWLMNGEDSTDSDPDAGDWIGSIRITEIEIKQAMSVVVALQRIMRRPRGGSGIIIESRCVLPDEEYGKIMLYQIDTFPNAMSEDPTKGSFHTTRILRYSHSVDNQPNQTKTAATERGCLT